MSSTTEIHTQRFVLKTLPQKSWELVLAYYQRNQKHFSPWTPSFGSDTLSAAHHQEQLLIHEEATRRKEGLRWYAFHRLDRPNHYIIGDFAISNITRGPIQTAWIGYKVDERVIGQGCATECLKEICTFAFKVLHLHRLEALIMPSNTASIRVAEKAGFKLEGTARKALLINGVWEDHLRFSLLKDEFSV